MMDGNKYFESLIDYSNAIMQKCISDSDDAVRSISDVMDILLKDSSRISKMSADTLGAMKNLEVVISEVGSQASSSSTIKKLITALSGLVQEHKSVNDVFMPIVEALQFQDAIRQQMENLGKVLEAWYSARVEVGPNPTNAQLTALGEKMLKLTTMQSERDIIRRHISGLSDEVKVDDVLLF